MLKEAMLYEEEGEKIRCNVCAHHCLIGEDKWGICRTRQNIDGKLYTHIYGTVSSMHADPIEKKPLYHFFPGTFVFSLGTISCNFRCRHCQNSDISQVGVGEVYTVEVMPEEVVEQAKETGCKGVAWTYNEPTIWFEYTYDSAKLAKKEGLYTVYVTNGFLSEDALNEIAPFLDAANVDVKAFSEDFYKRVCGAKLEPVLNTCERMYEKGMHIELTYLVIPGYNDKEEEIGEFVEWVVGLSPSIPVHFSRFYPAYLMKDVPSTDIRILERAYSIAKGKGVEYVYLGNVYGHRYENTFCPECGELLVERVGYDIRVKISEARCPRCGRDINITF
ncbi:MAG: AmmeMemoRadiSam system radical SAM enzyme [Candidatus Methanospirareceae archaeon]